MYMSLLCSDSGAAGEMSTLGERRFKIWKETMASHFNDVLQGWLNEKYSIVRESSATFRLQRHETTEDEPAL